MAHQCTRSSHSEAAKSKRRFTQQQQPFHSSLQLLCGCSHIRKQPKIFIFNSVTILSSHEFRVGQGRHPNFLVANSDANEKTLNF